MKKIVKQVVGIDVAHKELVICLGAMFDDWTPQIYDHKAFANSTKGFIALLAWVRKNTQSEADLRFVMEATGVYHEALAYFLNENNHAVSIVLPAKISNYARTLDTKTVTDKTASEAITMFGLERKLTDWKRPDPIYKELKQLTRERDQVVQMRTMAKNHLHADQAEARPNPESIKRTKKQIEFFNKQILQIQSEIRALTKKDNRIKNTTDLICTIPGVGMLTAVTVLAETNGFELIGNKKQLTSYAGLDVREKQSGTSVKGKPRISKRGNKFIRKAMHLPALTTIRHSDRYKAIFARHVSKHGIKMKAAVAVQRKILELIYTIYKTNKPYDPTYLKNQGAEKLLPEQTGSRPS